MFLTDGAFLCNFGEDYLERTYKGVEFKFKPQALMFSPYVIVFEN